MSASSNLIRCNRATCNLSSGSVTAAPGSPARFGSVARTQSHHALSTAAAATGGAAAQHSASSPHSGALGGAPPAGAGPWAREPLRSPFGSEAVLAVEEEPGEEEAASVSEAEAASLSSLQLRAPRLLKLC
jgi:hypothetical protein